MVETDRGTGQMYISWNVRPIQNELVIHGTKGVMHVDCYLQVITLRKTYPAPKPVQPTANVRKCLPSRRYPAPMVRSSSV